MTSHHQSAFRGHNPLWRVISALLGIMAMIVAMVASAPVASAGGANTSLTLVKELAGDAPPSGVTTQSWTLNAKGDRNDNVSGTSGVSQSFELSQGNTETFVLSESNGPDLAGFALTNVTCVKTSSGHQDPVVSQDGGGWSVKVDQKTAVTCTFTNTYTAPESSSDGDDNGGSSDDSSNDNSGNKNNNDNGNGGGNTHDKVWVCKYVGQPGSSERLKSGKNPIAVSSSATVGQYFNDAQGRSYVLDVQTPDNTGRGNSYIGSKSCPNGDQGQSSDKYVTVVWQMPDGNYGSTTPTWPQQFVSKTTSTNKTLDVPVPGECGTAYQVDSYLISKVPDGAGHFTDGLKLTGSSGDSSWFDGKAPSGWNFDYKIVINPKCTPTLTTSATDTAELGGTIQDTATLVAPLHLPTAWAPSPAVALGTVTFKLYGPMSGTITSRSCVDPGKYSVGNLVYQSDPVNVADDGTATSPTYTPAQAGTYAWVATYSGNNFNNGASGTCGDAGEISTVTQSTTLTLKKQVIDVDGNPSFSTAWTLAATNKYKPSDQPINGAPSNAENGVSAPVTPKATYRLSESGGPQGYAAQGWECTGAKNWSAKSATVTPQAGENVTCTVTNKAVAAKVTLTKTWVDATDGDKVDLTIANGARVGNGSSVAPNTTTDATLNVQVGQTVTLAETPGGSNVSTYDSSLACTYKVKSYGRYDTRDVDLSDGQFTIIDAMVDKGVNCTFTNTAKPKVTVVLQKAWVKGAAGDSAALSINSAAEGQDGFATATVPSGGSGSSVGSATLTVEPGSTVGLAEALGSGNTGGYVTTGLQCDNARVSGWHVGRLSGSFTAPESGTVTCTFTNERTWTLLTLVKKWVNGEKGDSTTISVGSDRGPLGSSTSKVLTNLVSTFVDIAHPVLVKVYSGEQVSLSEAMGEGNAGSYTPSLDCTSGSVTNGSTTQGSVTVPADHLLPILCTYTNTRSSVKVELQKQWANGADGDSANLVINGASKGSGTATATVPDSGSGVSAQAASATVKSGSTVSLSEALNAGNTGVYTVSDLSCTDGGNEPWTPEGWEEGDTTASFQAPESGTVTCTFTNTRDEVTVHLQKKWTNAKSGDSTDLSINGADGENATGFATSVASGTDGIDGEDVATESVTPGATVDIAEALAEEIQASYDTPTASCVAGEMSLDVSAGESADAWSFAAPESGTVTCTITNTRKSTLPPNTPNPPVGPQALFARPAIGTPQCTLEGNVESLVVSPVVVNGISYTTTKNADGSVTVTAKADIGYELTIPSGWTDNGNGTASITVTPDSDGVICVGGESSTVPPSSSAGAVAPPSTSIEVKPTSQSVEPGGAIAYTGFDTVRFGLLALVLLLGGAALVTVGTLRRKPRQH